jgi:hypothetical protein
MGTERISRVTVSNPSTQPQLVILEPWADEYTLAPRAAYTFEASSPLEGWLTVEYQDQAVIVSAWDSCVGRVYDVTGQLIDSLDIRVPDFRTPRSQDPGAAV